MTQRHYMASENWHRSRGRKFSQGLGGRQSLLTWRPLTQRKMLLDSIVESPGT